MVPSKVFLGSQFMGEIMLGMSCSLGGQVKVSAPKRSCVTASVRRSSVFAANGNWENNVVGVVDPLDRWLFVHFIPPDSVTDQCSLPTSIHDFTQSAYLANNKSLGFRGWLFLVPFCHDVLAVGVANVATISHRRASYSCPSP